MIAVTGFYVALAALAVCVYVPAIARMRYRLQVVLGDGGQEGLARLSRAHGNFVETVPLGLLLMAVLEMAGYPLWFLHLMGMAMVLSRMSHYVGLTTGKGYGIYRAAGMMLMMAVYICGAAAALWSFFAFS